jgi:hypothetical protein
MKLNTNKKSKLKIYAGLAGVAICFLGLYYFEYLLEAPNEATLTYWQSRGALGIVILFIISGMLLWQAVSATIFGKRETS